MNLKPPISTSIVNSIMLFTFLLGGVLTPTVHSIQHGLEWQDAKSKDEVCDHSDHETGFENVNYDFELDDCTSCVSRWNSVAHDLTSSKDGSLGQKVWHDQTDLFIALGPYSSGARAPPAV
ncbi:MAG: hypothetical protein HOC28_12675 [Bacteroidetes Order II. Incertae sedis bacterium]|jgi:hypothetical protein|nr:hypothetical protein [Bacteroidetes Order II. bacterium]MBT4053080.1 hypothetical protein [Bacteroidetes Order II. bacterium]MBT4603982.1 hypothetical protein [Bacteroidetes Order II. bacterium]MBT5250014.1 hypothetical protein [Bacteroidetes Order II. bacterium]MBT6200572.1 hypothetical protein [Bacteroidetes Order II. bacterium]